MALQSVLIDNLGAEFDIGNIEAGKIHLLLKAGELLLDGVTGEIGLDPAAVAAGETLTSLAEAGGILNYTDEAGTVTPIDLNVLVANLETLTSLVAGTTAAAALTYTDENGAAMVLDLSTVIADGQTLTVLALSGTTLTYTDEAGTANAIDLAPAIAAGETLTTFAYDAGTTTLTYTDEAGNATAVDLSALSTDIYVDGATFDPVALTLTFTDNDGATPNVVVDLSTLRSALTNNGDGTWTHNDGSGTTVIIRSVSADAGNLLTAGSDGGAFFDASGVRVLADVEVQDAFGVTLYYGFSTNL